MATSTTNALASSSSSSAPASGTPGPSYRAQDASSTLPDDDRFFSSLERASSTVKAFMQEDERWEDLSDQLSAAQYQYKLQLVAPWAPLEKRRMLSIPDAVLEASSTAETHAAQGLFPEIDRAWIVIDQRLYLWNYLDGSRSAFESYEHPERVIRSVGLVRPKPGVFVDQIRHVLVVCTVSSITLLGLAFEGAGPANEQVNGMLPKGKELKLFVTEMNITTEGVEMSDVQGSESGRVFCKGNDGCLYEILYQANEGWFSHRCSIRNVTSPKFSNLVPSFIQGKQKETLDVIAVDSTRNIVYTLHRGIEIEVHHLPSKDSSKSPNRIARARDVCRTANMICPNTTLLQPNEFLISSLTPIAPSESKNVHLVAVTTKGVRLYFATQRGGWRGLGYGSVTHSSNDPSAPTCIELIYVRPPPPAGQTQSQEGGMAIQQVQQQQQMQSANYGTSLPSTDFAPHQPLINGVNHAFYADGLFLAAGQYQLDTSGGTDCVLATSRAIPTGEPRPAASAGAMIGMTATPSLQGNVDLADTATDILIQGATWAIAEVPRQPRVSSSGERIHPLALQMTRAPRVLLVLTSYGLFVMTEQRPIDTFKGLLEVGTLYDQTVHEFFKKFGQGQSCAMSLAIASHNSQLARAPEAHLSATEAAEDTPRLLSSEVVSHAWRIFFDFGGYPRYEPPPYPSQPASDGKVTLSGRHDGLAIYLTRLLMPFWREKITRKEVVPGEGERQVPHVAAEALLGPQRELRSLQKFLDQNAQLFGLGTSSGVSRAGQRGEGDQVAFKTEQDSFDALRALLSRTLEALSFVLLLVDYNLPNLVLRCHPETQAALLLLTYSDLVTSRSGRDTARVLVEAVIDAQISSQVSIDAVAEVLQERCGSFCNADDVRLYKALECIRRAKESRDERLRTESLRESVRLLNRATSNLPMEKLGSICKDYRDLRFVQGAIELPLKCASSWDRGQLAQGYRVDGMPAEDQRKKVYDLVLRCYHLVLETLEAFDAQTSEMHAKAPEQQNQQALTEIEDRRQNAYDQAQASTDPLFHVAMYDWLLQRNKTDELLKMRTPFLEDYLRSEPITLERCLLLCLWYVSVGQNFSAAQLYAGLAQSIELDITLDDRIEYLSKASSNAKSAFVNSYELVNFTTDVDEKLEVAQVQVEVFRAVQESEEIDEGQKVALLEALDSQLLDISALYRDFAEPYQMHEIKLLVYHVSDHRDLELVQLAWDALLNEAHRDASNAERRFERVESVVVELGRRFYPSDVAFPIDLLTDMLEKYAFGEMDEQSMPTGWPARTMVKASAPPEFVFDVLAGAVETRREPFQSTSGYLFLLADLGSLIEFWTREVLGVAVDPIGISNSAGFAFPARRIDDVITTLIIHLTSLPPSANEMGGGPDRQVEAIKTKLKNIQELIRRSF